MMNVNFSECEQMVLAKGGMSKDELMELRRCQDFLLAEGFTGSESELSRVFETEDSKFYVGRLTFYFNPWGKLSGQPTILLKGSRKFFEGREQKLPCVKFSWALAEPNLSKLKIVLGPLYSALPTAQ